MSRRRREPVRETIFEASTDDQDRALLREPRVDTPEDVMVHYVGSASFASHSAMSCDHAASDIARVTRTA